MVGAIDTEFPPSRVKLIRALLGMTQEAFAEKYGIGSNTVSRLEKDGEVTNLQGPTLGALLKAARDAGA